MNIKNRSKISKINGKKGGRPKQDSKIRIELPDISLVILTPDQYGSLLEKYGFDLLHRALLILDEWLLKGGKDAEKYIGKVPNNDSGRTSLWSDVIKIHQNLANINAIEGFEAEDIVVEQGEAKKSVQISGAITVVGTMTKLYMRTVVA